MRFTSAVRAGLDEDAVARLNDGYADTFNPAEVAALQLTDAIVGDPNRLEPATIDALREHYSPEQIVELALGVGLFMGMSKVLINLGLEPEDMPVTSLPTPGEAS